MKSFISIILSLVLTSVYAIDRRPPNVPFDPVVSQFGFQTTDGVFSGNGSDLFNVNPKSGSEMTNMSFFTSSGIVIGGLDGNGTFTLSDTNYLFAVSFDPTVPQFFITDTNLTEKFKVLGSLLYLDNPIIVGSLTGNGSGLSNAVDIIAGSNITVTTNANKRSFTIASTGGGSGGSPTTISNNYFVAASSFATYTNSTAYWLYVSTELYQSAAVVSLAKAQFMVDTNVNGTLDRFCDYLWEIGENNVHYQSSGWVPPGASYQWTNTFGNMALFNFAIQQTYLIEGSGGGSSGPLTNSVIQTGDLYVTNNLSVAGTFNVSQLNATNVTFAGKSNGVVWIQSDGSVVATNLPTQIGAWTGGYGFGTLPAAGFTIPVGGYTISYANTTTNYGLHLFKSPISCRISNLFVSLVNGSGTSHANTNYTVWILTNGVAATQTATLVTNIASSATPSYATNTTFNLTIAKGDSVAFFLANTNSGHTVTSSGIGYSIGVYLP